MGVSRSWQVHFEMGEKKLMIHIPLSKSNDTCKGGGICRKIKIKKFEANMVWFEGFKDRNDITFQTVCDENASLNLEEANMWFNKRMFLV